MYNNGHPRHFLPAWCLRNLYTLRYVRSNRLSPGNSKYVQHVYVIPYRAYVSRSPLQLV